MGLGRQWIRSIQPAFGHNQYISAIAAGAHHSVAVRDDGSVIQWGQNLGNVPTGLTNAVALAAGFEQNIALLANGTVATWGITNTEANSLPYGLPRCSSRRRSVS